MCIVVPTWWWCWSIITTISSIESLYRRLWSWQWWRQLLETYFVAHTVTKGRLTFLFWPPAPTLPYSPDDPHRSDRRASATAPWPVELTHWWHKATKKDWHEGVTRGQARVTARGAWTPTRMRKNMDGQIPYVRSDKTCLNLIWVSISIKQHQTA